ncbi:MAG: hypothetical protein JXR31_14775 [Prolixibacteraceae bacterium]|nr:hypothetical protein [Prolixibacteraceae bacterium]MBN2775517.1 hypothetical protein [Prolixibacteraceae bacterium]
MKTKQFTLLSVILLFFIFGCDKNSFEKNDSGTFTDERDNNKYKWIKIGEQIWMAENLAYLPEINLLDNRSETEARYYINGYYGTDLNAAKETENYKFYGVLYNWTAACEVCPSGWHLPSDDEWKELERTIGIEEEQLDLWMDDRRGVGIGTKLKSTEGWIGSSYGEMNGNGTNDFGFNALSGGYSTNGTVPPGEEGYWWTSTNEFHENTNTTENYPWARTLKYYHTYVDRQFFTKNFGFSVRCVKD